MNYGAISTHPVTIAIVLVVAAIIVFRVINSNVRERQQINQIIAEGEKQKDSNGRSRDSRKQGTLPVGSDIESSDRSKSDRSERLMEEKDKLDITSPDRPRSLIAAERELLLAEESLRQIQGMKGVARPSTSVAAERFKRHEVERLRAVRNEVLIESRDWKYTRDGKVHTARQYHIGQSSVSRVAI